MLNRRMHSEWAEWVSNCPIAHAHNYYVTAEAAVSPSMIMAASTTPEADTLKEFIPDLVTAICDCVQSVSDQCLAKGLISQTTHERVLESRGTSKEQARLGSECTK